MLRRVCGHWTARVALKSESDPLGIMSVAERPQGNAIALRQAREFSQEQLDMYVGGPVLVAWERSFERFPAVVVHGDHGVIYVAPPVCVDDLALDDCRDHLEDVDDLASPLPHRQGDGYLDLLTDVFQVRLALEQRATIANHARHRLMDQALATLGLRRLVASLERKPEVVKHAVHDGLRGGN
ncbi:MAG TPA: hypothetical protein VFO25_08480 [Candidatus Eremiobacteraceae bacterium]|nr:hypothetical protein [Candidatus Eremiobacteraceae bacterium]